MNLSCPLRSNWKRALFAALLAVAAHSARSHEAPVKVGLDAEFGLQGSISAQSIEFGLRVAIGEVNAAGGVLNGRPLELVISDNRSITARAASNLRAFAAMPDLVGVFGGKFSPVILEAVPIIHELRLPFFAVWSSAEPIVDNGMSPNYVFRLALRDSLAMPKMLKTAEQRGFGKVGLLLANTGWGRSNLSAAERYLAESGKPAVVQVAWHNWGEKSLVQRYQSLRRAGAQAVLLVANDDDAATLVREISALPAAERLPLICHQGVAGGSFVKLAGSALHEVDVTVLQTFNFFRADPTARSRFTTAAERLGAPLRFQDVSAPTGVAHAYDMLHILARAIDRAGSTDRQAIRAALEQLPEHRGLIKNYRPPFTPARHEALGPDELIMARYGTDAVLVPDDR